MLVPLTTYGRRLAGRRVLHFDDNTVALSAMVYDYVGKEDLATTTNADRLMAAGLRFRAYMGYVASKANIADLPSRGEFALLRALGGDEAFRPAIVPTFGSMVGPLAPLLSQGLTI